jgi:5-methylcytosine-specific restriction endonuclease McrA
LIRGRLRDVPEAAKPTPNTRAFAASENQARVFTGGSSSPRPTSRRAEAWCEVTKHTCKNCGGVTPVGSAYCPRCDPDPDRRRQKAKAQGVTSAYWKRLRKAVLERDGYRCQLQVDERCTLLATTVHLDPVLEGNHLLALPHHCQSACLHCHGVVDAPRASESRDRGGICRS